MEAHVVEHYAATACRREVGHSCALRLRSRSRHAQSTICNIFITHHHEDHSGNLAGSLHDSCARSRSTTGTQPDITAALQRLFPLARAHAPSGSLPRLFNGFHEECKCYRRCCCAVTNNASRSAYYRRIVWGQFEPYREQRVPLPQPLAVVSPADALALRQSDCTYR